MYARMWRIELIVRRCWMIKIGYKIFKKLWVYTIISMPVCIIKLGYWVSLVPYILFLCVLGKCFGNRAGCGGLRLSMHILIEYHRQPWLRSIRQHHFCQSYIMIAWRFTFIKVLIWNTCCTFECAAPLPPSISNLRAGLKFLSVNLLKLVCWGVQASSLQVEESLSKILNLYSLLMLCHRCMNVCELWLACRVVSELFHWWEKCYINAVHLLQ